MHVRMKLILSYALIIAVCLTLTATVSAVLLRTYQNRFAKQRIEIIADTTAPLLHDNNDPARFDAAQQVARTAGQTQTRIIVLEAALRDLTTVQARGARGNTIRQFDATVRQDTAGILADGTAVAIPRSVYEDWQRWQREQTAAAATPPGTPGRTPAATPIVLKNAQLTLPQTITTRIALQAGQPVDLALVPLRGERGMPSGNFRILIVAEPVGSVARPLATVLGTLAPAAGIAFLISILGALLLARSITRPLVGLTGATRALARGDFSQRVPEDGDREVAELGRSFNAMAKEIERVRRRERDFLANISHDLKTPLTSIQGFSGAIIDGTCPPEDAPAAARIIHDEARRMGHLVGDVLQLSRLEAGQDDLTLAPIELHDLLATTARRFGDAATRAGVTIRVEPGARPPLVALGDHGRLEQILGNLVENALRYTPAGGRIDLLCAPMHEGDAAFARVSVRDTGSGIPAADLARIFERFYQADKSRVAGRAGSGLGLAIVKGLVERHGGTVAAESVVGAGTTISFTLPLAPAATTASASVHPAGSTPHPPRGER